MSTVAQGYDGQYYYRLALDPLTTQATAHGITLDLPAYRQQRIVYPALAWAAAAGDPQRVPAALVAVNVVGLCAVAAIGGRLAQTAGRHALWGTIFSSYPGFVVTLSRDLTEIAAAALLLAGLLLLRRGNERGGAVGFLLAAFTRETTLIASAATALTRFAIRPPAIRRWLPFVLPALALVVWQQLLAQRWGATPLSQGVTALDPPLLGLLAAAWLNAERLEPGKAAVWLLVLAFALASVVIAARAFPRSVAEPHERTAWLGYVGLALVLEANIWANGAGMLRALTELEMLGATIVLGSAGLGRGLLLGANVAAAALLVAVRVAV